MRGSAQQQQQQRRRRAQLGRSSAASVRSLAREGLRGGGPGVESPSDLVRVQRARILGAMVRVVAEKGVAGATVSRVVKRAGVSRRTFYESFAGWEDCFLAVFEDGVERARMVVSEALASTPSSPGWREQVRAGLGALLGFFDREPALGSVLVVDALGAGPRVLERRARVLDELVGIMDRGREGSAGKGGRGSSSPSPASSPVSGSPLMGEGIVGAVFSVIHARMVHEDRRPLVELLSPLMGMIVLPYQGRAAAAKELARPAMPAGRGGRAGPPAGTSGGRAPRPPDPLDGLGMRMTYRTLMVLSAITAEPGASNRRIADSAGIHDQGQISKLLGRLAKLGLIHNDGNGQPRGEPNAWTLTPRGAEVQRALAIGS
jgi:AcrR family transcriptional regulator